jgi:integrase
MRNKNYQLQIDIDVKNEFLEQYIPATRANYFITLKVADQFEAAIDTKLYNLSMDEIDDLMFTKFKNTTLYAITSIVSILQSYVDFCIGKNLVPHMDNRFRMLTNTYCEKYVSKQATNNKYITWAKIKELEKQIYNDMDKLIMELTYQSVRGRTKTEATCEELINLKISDINKNDTVVLRRNDKQFL